MRVCICKSWLGSLSFCKYVFVREQAQMDGATFQDLAQKEYLDIVQDNVAAYTERLNFSARDWHKLTSCALSWKSALGGEDGDHDEEALAEVGATDSDVDESGGVVLGSREGVLKSQRQVQEASSSSSSPSSQVPALRKSRPMVSMKPRPPMVPPKLRPPPPQVPPPQVPLMQMSRLPPRAPWHQQLAPQQL